MQIVQFLLRWVWRFGTLLRSFKDFSEVFHILIDFRTLRKNRFADVVSLPPPPPLSLP